VEAFACGSVTDGYTHRLGLGGLVSIAIAPIQDKRPHDEDNCGRRGAEPADSGMNPPAVFQVRLHGPPNGKESFRRNRRNGMPVKKAIRIIDIIGHLMSAGFIHELPKQLFEIFIFVCHSVSMICRSFLTLR